MTDLPFYVAIGSLAVAVGGLVVALVRLWFHVHKLEDDRRRFDQFIGEMRRLADASSSSVVLQSQAVQSNLRTAVVYESAQMAMLRQQAQTADLQQQALQHQRNMDLAKLVLGVWDRLRSESDNDEDDEQ
jgi:hypothetical protein